MYVYMDKYVFVCVCMCTWVPYVCTYMYVWVCRCVCVHECIMYVCIIYDPWGRKRTGFHRMSLQDSHVNCYTLGVGRSEELKYHQGKMNQGRKRIKRKASL